MEDVVSTLLLAPAQQATRAAAQLAGLALVDSLRHRSRDREERSTIGVDGGKKTDVDVDIGDAEDSGAESDSDDETRQEAAGALSTLERARVRVLDFSAEGDIVFFLKTVLVASGAAAAADGSDGLEERLRVARGPAAAVAALAAGDFAAGDVVLMIGMTQPSMVTKDMFRPLLEFVAGGGTAVFLHCSPRVLGGLFPETIRATLPTALVRASVRLNLSKLEHRSLFTGFRNLEVCFLDPLRLSFEVVEGATTAPDTNLTVLAHTNVEETYQEPLLVRFDSGKGKVFVFVTKFLPTRSCGQTALTPLSDLVPPGAGKATIRNVGPAEGDWPPSRKADIAAWLDAQGVTADSKRSWMAAKKAGFGAAPEIARGYMAFGELLLKLLLRSPSSVSDE